MPEREYRMEKRARAMEETRRRIVEATAALHAEQGVAATSYVQIAERAGVGPATVYRHFPTLGSLVEACGAAIWTMIRPPVPEAAPAIFAGIAGRRERLRRLVEEIDSFHERAVTWIDVAERDRDRVPELAAFLQQIETGMEALVREALDPEVSEATVEVVAVLTDLAVWRRLKRLGGAPDEVRATLVCLLDCAIAATEQQQAKRER